MRTINPTCLDQKCRYAINDRAAINRVVAIKIRDIARLSEVLNPQRLNTVTGHRAYPFKAGGVPIHDSY